ncbi:Stk1 family PASTA domain-containing Ser/Thr kinase [Ileibacterium valens]|uniref:Stk1 family PASTA domain-containing Ser/Thr kinase n=2 Tax=Ileibacterium valens TaxID=1862668 RepID=UPI002729751C|nr:Stk1 family PASTA domain-containing Ser/Thr kinase [Ileibacterium valens]
MTDKTLHTIASRYTILNLIGQGGMADVYLAHDEILNREVAIKVLRPKLSEDPMTLVRFTREASAASRLSHPNVVDIYDVGESDGLHYIVMEYIRGQTLKQLIVRRGALDYREALSMMKQLISAVVSAHHHQIIHRDIKPQNILVKSDGTLKITDFGIAIANGSVSLTHNNAVMGSAHYLSPESAQGMMPDEKVDIYSMGIVFYELLTGQVPFRGNNPAEIALKHMTEPLPSLRRFNPQIPQSIENIVIRASAKDPAERYQSAAAMQEDLEHCLDFGRKNEKPLVLKTQRLNALPSAKKDDGITTSKKTVAAKTSASTQRNRTSRQSAAISSSKRNNLRDNLTDYKGSRINQSSSQRIIPKPQPKKKSGLARAMIFGCAGAVLACVICITLVGTGVIKISGIMGYETFPDLADTSIEQASKILADAGFDTDKVLIEMEVSDSIDPGRVIESDIKAGQVISTKDPITLIVSKGPSYLISDYTGQYMQDVVNKFHEDGVELDIEVEYQGAANTLPGIILSQKELNPGDRIDPTGNQKIIFTVSQYPTIVIPSELIGMGSQEAKDFLNDRGIAAVIRPSSGSGQVTYTDPPVGTEYTQEGTDSVVILYD